ncbi:MAG: hypothetical protein WCP77_09920 [Roseococcus sp.]
MSARTPEQLHEDQVATRLARSLVNTLAHMRVAPQVAVNALAGALGAYVAMASQRPEQADELMRAMATQAREQMEMQIAIQRAEASGVVGHA